jgi:hypothetical protein
MQFFVAIDQAAEIKRVSIALNLKAMLTPLINKKPEYQSRYSGRSKSNH